MVFLDVALVAGVFFGCGMPALIAGEEAECLAAVAPAFVFDNAGMECSGTFDVFISSY